MDDEEGGKESGSGKGGEEHAPRGKGRKGDGQADGQDNGPGERQAPKQDEGPADQQNSIEEEGIGEWRVPGLDAKPEERPQDRPQEPGAAAPPPGGELWVGSGRREGADYPGRQEIHKYQGGNGRGGNEGDRRREASEEASAPRRPWSPAGPGAGDREYGGRGGDRREGWREGKGRGEEGGRGWRDGGGRGGEGRQDWRGGGGRGGGTWGGREDGSRGGGIWGGREGGMQGDQGMPRRNEGAEGRPAPPEHVDREIVLPGDMLDSGNLKAGPGAYRDGEGVFAACLGIKSVRGDIVGVIPLSGKYIPRVGDIVVGKVIEMTPSAWVIDLNSPYVAPLPGSETPWTVEFGETSKYMSLGDTVIVQIKDVNETRRVGVTMLGPDLRKVVGGQTMDVDATKVPRLIGRGGSMIGLLKRLTRCRILVGQNGRVWMDGTVEDVTVAMGAIRMIEQNAHRLGLTDAVANFIQGMRNQMESQRAEREKRNEAAEEQAITKDRVQRMDEKKKEEEE